MSAQKNKTHYKSYMGVLYISKNNFVSKYRGRTPGQPTKIRKRRITNDKTCNHWGCNTHTHTHGNLINNKKINIYTIFMCFLRKRIAYKNI